MPIEPQLVYPPSDVYENSLSSLTQVTREPIDLYFVEKVEYPKTGGILVYKFGGVLVDQEDGNKLIANRVPLLYPEKGFPTPEAVGAINIAKRGFLGYVQFLSMKAVIIPLSLLIFVPWKTKIKVLEKLLHSYSALGDIVLEPHYLKAERYIPMVRELQLFITRFLENLGVKNDVGQAAKVFAMIIEYDSAYRTRLQDLFSETSKRELVKNPQAELVRLLEIFKQREKKSKKLAGNFQSMVRLLRIVLYHPKVKRAFIHAIQDSNFKLFQYDDADRYHCLKLNGYDFFGQSIQQREAEWIRIHNGNPPKAVTVSRS